MQSIIRSYRQLVVGALVVMLIMSAAMPASAAAPTEASLSQLQSMLETIKNWFQPQVKGVATITVTNDAELATAMKNATGGETIQLAPGTYSPILVVGGQYNKLTVGATSFSGGAPTLASKVTITSRDVNNPAIVKGIDVRQNGNWHFNNLNIAPGYKTKAFIAVKLDGPNIVFENSTIDYGDYTGWTQTDWLARAGGGIEFNSANGIVKNNTLRSVYHGIVVGKSATGAQIVNNTLDGIGGDASRVLADDVVITNNFFKNFRVNDGNHDDCMQSWGLVNGSVNQAGVVKNVTVKNNICLDTESNRSDPLVSKPQGYAAFDGSMENWTVENNVYISTAYHGMNYSGATNLVLKNNTIIDSDGTVNGTDSVWIRVSGNKGGTIPPTGNTITGNISNKFPTSVAPAVTTFTNNQIVKIVDYDKYFTNWQAGDVRLKANSTIQNVGANLDPATVGSNRTITNPTPGTGTPTPTTTPVTVPSLNFTVQAQGLTATTSFSLNNGCLGYVLDWGDGKTDSFFGGNGPMCTMAVTAVSKAHTYNQGGTYTVKVTPYFGTTAGTAQTKSVTITAPTTTQTDTDRDGIADSQDNCRTVANVNQANFDNDTQGDACDTDDDNDNIPDTQEKTGCVLNPSSSCGSTATTTPGTGGGTATSSNGASLTLTLNPASIATGGKATLSWTSTNVSTCTASGDWTGSKLRSGTQSTGIMSAAGTRTYTLTCTGSSGTVTKSVTLTVTGEGAGTGTSTPATSCVSGGRTYPAGTSLQTIVNPDGSSRTIADASFVCTNGQWVITGSLPTAATGTRVITTDTVNVRSTANGVVVGTQPAGRLGTRSNATPVTAGGYQWVYVNFDTNPDGFVASQFLSTTIPGTTPTAGGMTQAEINAKIQALMAEIVKLQALLAQLQTR